MRKIVKLTESELHSMINECVINILNESEDEGKIGRGLRTAALGLGLAGGMLGGMNNADAQTVNPRTELYNYNDSVMKYQNTMDSLSKGWQDHGYGNYLSIKQRNKYIDSYRNAKNRRIELQATVDSLINVIKREDDSIAADNQRRQDSIKVAQKHISDSVTLDSLQNLNFKVSLTVSRIIGNNRNTEQNIFDHKFNNLEELFDTINLVYNKIGTNKRSDEIYTYTIDIPIIKYKRSVSLEPESHLYKSDPYFRAETKKDRNGGYNTTIKSDYDVIPDAESTADKIKSLKDDCLYSALKYKLAKFCEYNNIKVMGDEWNPRYFDDKGNEYTIDKNTLEMTRIDRLQTFNTNDL